MGQKTWTQSQGVCREASHAVRLGFRQLLSQVGELQVGVTQPCMQLRCMVVPIVLCSGARCIIRAWYTRAEWDHVYMFGTGRSSCCTVYSVDAVRKNTLRKNTLQMPLGRDCVGSCNCVAWKKPHRQGWD